MDQPNDSSFDRDLELAMKQVPQAIRNVFAGNQIPNVSRTLMQKYALHVDQAAILEREIMLLLLGVNDPTQFVGSLEEEAHLPSGVITGIANDVNDLIFVPLRNQMQHPAQAARPAASLRPTPPKVAPGTPDYTGRMRIQTPPAPPAQIRPKPVAPAMPAVPQPMRTSAAPHRAPLMDPERELPVGEGQSAAAPLPPKAALPRQNFQPRPAAPAPLQEPVAPRPRPVMPDPPAPRPNASAAPANLPGAFTPPPFPPRPPQTPTPPSISGGYGPADPYREPVE